MDLLTIISQAENEFPRDEKAFYGKVAILILQTRSIFSLLDSGKAVTDALENYVKNVDTNPRLYDKTSIDPTQSTVGLQRKLALLYKRQQAILSCPKIDEHVVLLASLKGLEKQFPTFYKMVLNEILSKQLHKMQQPSHSSHMIGRSKEIAAIMQVLLRSERNNVILIGPSGVGKTTLATAIQAYLPQRELVRLFPGSDTFFDQIINILSMTDENALFFLDEIPTFEISQLQYLLENGQIIATANDVAFKKLAADNPHIINRCEIISLEEPETEDLHHILEDKVAELAQKYALTLEAGCLEEIEQLTTQYIHTISFPAKGISLLEEVMITAKAQGVGVATKDLARVIVSSKTNIPISSLTEFEKKDLAQLGEKLKEKVKGQDEAVEKIAATIQRARLGFKKENKPIGSFLFVGPSGVGKTELAKALAKEVFGDEEAMVRLDMSEFAEAHMVQRLIGSPPGYIGFEEGGQLTNPIKAKPYSLILLDELEKAHPRVFDIFLQVLDDGRLTDGQGKKVDFRNTVVVATSNAGIEDMLDLIAEGKSQDIIEKETKEVLSDYFRVEFLNRFDGLVIFKPLSQEALIGIAKIQIGKLQIELQKRNITLTVSGETIAKLAEESFDPRYGARGLLRLLQDTIENRLAEMILAGALQENQTVAF